MKRCLFFLLLIATMIACKDNKSDEDLLIKGKWIWEDESNVDDKITLTFNNDETYLIETYVSIPVPSMVMPAPVKYMAELSGNWVRRGDEVTFTTISVTIPDRDDSTIVSSGKDDTVSDIIFVSLPDHYSGNNFQYENNENQIIVWKIIELTDHKLIVSSDGNIIKYHRN